MVEEEKKVEKESLEDIAEEAVCCICDWCGYKLDEHHDDDMCKYLNR